MRAREFTATGIRRARRFLKEVREDPVSRRSPPRDLLKGRECTRRFRGKLTIERRRRPFRSRREIGEYLAPRLRPLAPGIAERTSLWSWLGLFYFGNTVRVVNGAIELSPLDETFVIDPLDTQNLRGSHRHYLRSAWQLYEVHGDNAAFLLNQPPTARGDIADRILQSRRIFNSKGIVPLILDLYTEGNRTKRGFQSRPGGLRHLLRVLDQLERTHDVYGMSPEALACILPEEFKPWTNRSAPTARPAEDQGTKKPDTARSIGRRDGGPGTGKRRVGGDDPPRTDGSQSGATEPAPKDPKLEQWEANVRQRGSRTMGYKGFRTTVRVNAVTGALEGRVRSPAGGWIGSVVAPDAAAFVQALKRHVREHIS